MSLPAGKCSCVLYNNSMCFQTPNFQFRCCNCDHRIQRPYNAQNVINSAEIFTFTDGSSEPVRCTVCRGVVTYDVVIKEFYCQPTRNGCGKYIKATEMLTAYERIDRAQHHTVAGTPQKVHMSGVHTGRISCSSPNTSEAAIAPPRQIPPSVVKCECGNDAANSGGIHSPWCPKAKGNA